MPPAFVLSQDQTLKFVSLTSSARSEDRQPMRQELQGADTCTVKRNGYEWTCITHRTTWSFPRMWRRLRLTGFRSLEVPGPGAVAHMSLHQKPTMSKNHSTLKGGQQWDPDFHRGTGYPSMLATVASRAGGSRQRRVGGAHIWGVRDSGQRVFAILFRRRSKWHLIRCLWNPFSFRSRGATGAIRMRKGESPTPQPLVDVGLCRIRGGFVDSILGATRLVLDCAGSERTYT